MTTIHIEGKRGEDVPHQSNPDMGHSGIYQDKFYRIS